MARRRKDVSDVIRGRHVWSGIFRHFVTVINDRWSNGKTWQKPVDAVELVSTAKKDYAKAALRLNRFFSRNRRFKNPEIISITYIGQLRA